MSPAVTLVVIRVLAVIVGFVVVVVVAVVVAVAVAVAVAVVVVVGVLENVVIPASTSHIPPRKGVLVVVHPNLEHTFFDPHFIAEL